MKSRFEHRREQILQEAQLKPHVYEGLLARLSDFLKPYCVGLGRKGRETHLLKYIQGLLSNLSHKNVESIAYLHDQGRRELQRFVGESNWEHTPMLMELAQQVGQTLGEADGVIVFDPSGFEKDGTHSVGVQRQWLGRLGKVDNGQVGIYMGYASRKGHTLCNERLYLPREWARARVRRRECGVPQAVRFQTRHELAQAMLHEQGAWLPHQWIAGDDEMGRSSGFRQWLREQEERYLLAVPSNTRMRDLTAAVPACTGPGAKPKAPWLAVSHWLATLPEKAWTRIEVCDGEKGALVVEAVKCRVQARGEQRQVGPEELLFVTRIQETKGWKVDYYLSNAAPETPLAELARVAKAEHRIEECFSRAKSQAGLADYEVRTWKGWHHHQVLSIIACWFLTLEAIRGKKMDGGSYGTVDSRLLGMVVE